MDEQYYTAPAEAYASGESGGAEPTAQLASVKSEGFVSGSIYTKVVQVLVYAAAVLTPLFYLPWTSSVGEFNKQMLLVVVASVGLVTWLLGVVVTGRMTLRSSPLDKGILALLGATVVGAVFSLAKNKSVFGLSISLSGSVVSVLALTVIYFLAVYTLSDRGRTLRNLVVVSLSLTIVFGLFQMLGWYFMPGGFTGTRAFSTVGALNAIGILAAVALPLFAKTGGRGAMTPWKVFAGVGLVGSIAVLGILNLWPLWLVALVGMLGMIAFDSLNATRLSEEYGRRGRFAMGRFIVPMVVIVLGAFLLLVKLDLSFKRNFPSEIGPSYSMSFSIAKSVLSNRLLFGWGPENFSLAYDRFAAGSLANTQLASVRFYDSIAEVFNWVVHTGAVGILALLLMGWCLVQVVARFGGSISESVMRGASAEWSSEASGVFAALLAITVAAFVYPFNITLAFVWCILVAMAALIVSGDRERTVDIEERPMYSLSASLGFIVGLILVLSGVYFSFVRYLADVHYASAATISKSEDKMTRLVRAIDLDPKNDRYVRDASQLALTILRSEAAATAPDPSRGARVQNLIASSVQLAQRAANAAPQEAMNWSNLGSVYRALTGLVDNVETLAEDAYRKASDLRPGDPTFDNETGSLWLARADLINSVSRGANAAALRAQYTESLQRAEDAFKRAVEKAPSFGLAIYNLGAVYDRENKVDEAIKQLEKIIPYNANEPTLVFELGLLYLRANNRTSAIAAMRRAVLLSPQYANARWYLGLLLEDQGDFDGAIAQMNEILKNNAGNEVLQQKIAQLETGRKAVPPTDVVDTKPIE